MNQNELSEKILLAHSTMRKIFIFRYELYNLLNIPFDLFFSKDIYNYRGKFYKISNYKSNNYRNAHVNSPREYNLLPEDYHNLDINTFIIFPHYGYNYYINDIISRDSMSFNTTHDQHLLSYLIRSIATKDLLSGKQLSILNAIDNEGKEVGYKDFNLLENIEKLKMEAI